VPPLLYFDPKLGRGYAFCPRSGGIFELMPDEYEILRTRTPPDEFRVLLNQMRAYDGKRYDVSGFVAHLASLGIIHDRLSYPVDVELELTRACNLRCTHCLVSAGEPLPDELPAERWVSLLNEMGKYSVRVVLTGGEPLVHPGFLDILAAAKRNGLAVRLLTNGTLVPERIDDLRGLLNPLTDEVQISLDGTRDTHDAIRGEGNFDRALAGVKVLIGAGIPVSVAFTALPQNRSDALPLYRQLARLGISAFRVGWGLPTGRQASSISYQSYLDLVEALRAEAEKTGVPVVGGQLGDALPVSPDSLYSCSAGTAHAFVSSTGDVYPCLLLRYPDLRMGSVRVDSLLTVWRSGPWDRLKRHLSGTKCASCPLFGACRGGCPGEALLFNGTLNAPAPSCRWNDGEH